MAKKIPTIWNIEEHTKIKHAILRRYLQAWLPILASSNGQIQFVDGFAGPGIYSGGEEGSPIIALRTLLEHPYFQKTVPGRKIKFLFIENNSERFASLQNEIEKLKKEKPIPECVEIDVKEGEFYEVIEESLYRLETRGGSVNPAFFFIDPFGFSGIPLDLIRRIAKTGRTEFLINFMYEYINRFLSYRDEKFKAQLDQLFGTPAWREIAEEYPHQRFLKLISLYRSQLKAQVGLKYVRTFTMKNEGNRVEYVLFFGTNHPQGLSKMKAAMWKADLAGGVVFSDFTAADPQGVLFGPEPDLEKLETMLIEQFRGKGFVPIEEVKRFVLEETPYSEEIHLKKLTLRPMENQDPPLLEARHTDKAKSRRKGTYPDGTEIRFT